jgi:hypothetical protein
MGMSNRTLIVYDLTVDKELAYCKAKNAEREGA